MLRTHIVPCTLPVEQAQALNQESGRIYTTTLVHHYRTYRHLHVWLSPMQHNRLLDAFCSPSFLHAHSVDAAQQDFYEACKTAKALQKAHPHARYPYKRKYYHTTTWKQTGIKVEGNRMRLALARGQAPIGVMLPDHLAGLPDEAYRQVQLVYSLATRNHHWHLTIKDEVGGAPCDAPQVMAVDLGEIHPAACTNGETATIISCRELRATAQHRNKKSADLQERLARCQKGSRRWKQLKTSLKRLHAQTKTKTRDLVHKVSRAMVEEAVAMDAGTIVIGDVRDVADKTRVGAIAKDGRVIKKAQRLSREVRQKLANWPHGQLRQAITYKAAALGIAVELINEAYTSKTCPTCGQRNKPKGRHYRCSACGYVGHRDHVGATNILSKQQTGKLAQLMPCPGIKYRHPFRRASVDRPDTRRVRGAVPVARASEDLKPLSRPLGDG